MTLIGSLAVKTGQIPGKVGLEAKPRVHPDLLAVTSQRDIQPDPTFAEYRDDLERERLRHYAEDLARFLDTAIRIPGTPIRIGLDPLLGLIPGIGDVLASAIGSYILFLASRLGVPKIVIVRMALNLILNGVIGAIPGAGDLFSVWFQSNVRNARLLRRHSSATMTPSTASDWVFVVGVLVAALAVIGGAMIGILWLIASLWQLVQ